MKRIVRMPDGTHLLFEGEAMADTWEVRTWRSNGVMERSVRPVIDWKEVGEVQRPLNDEEYLAWLHTQFEGKALEKQLANALDDIEQRRLRSLRASARRAKTMCRRVIITEGFDELLTLTYRENQEDRDLCKKHFNIWFKRMKRALGEFRFCASFERQERGAMHVHVATHKLPQHAVHKGIKIKAWELGTRIWRDIVGANNGMCFVGGRSRTGLPRRQRMGLAKMAAYVSKYIMKDFEAAPAESNRYSRSNGTQIGKSEKLILAGKLALLMEVTFECGEGDVVIAHRVSKWKDGVWLVTESPPVPLLCSR